MFTWYNLSKEVTVSRSAPSLTSRCKVRGSHSGMAEESCLLICSLFRWVSIRPYITYLGVYCLNEVSQLGIDL